MIDYYALLKHCEDGKQYSRFHLVHIFGEKDVDCALNCGYLASAGKNSIDDDTYMITEKGISHINQ